MTLQEKIICTAYTGTAFCEDEDYGRFLEYADKLMGRPCQTFEMADPAYWNRLRELSEPDFHKVLNGEYSSDERRRPKKIMRVTHIPPDAMEYEEFYCPRCYCRFGDLGIDNYLHYCPDCGQALDWSEVEG